MRGYICSLCPRNCRARRTPTENISGVCKVPFALKAALAAPHYWEEPCISGTKGSGAIFFSGCQLKCCYCQNHDLSYENKGETISIERLAEIFSQLEEKGVHNINLVSPTPYVPLIIKALELYRPKIPIVYNSGGYEKEETLEMLKGYVDIFLLDYKYASSDKADKYSRAKDYPQFALSALDTAYKITGPKVIDKNGIMKSGVIVRHLLLPGNTKAACEIIDILAKRNYDIIFSLMSQYTVTKWVDAPELKRGVTKREYEKVLNHMIDSGLDGYAQDMASADKNYIPDFNFSGIEK